MDSGGSSFGSCKSGDFAVDLEIDLWLVFVSSIRCLGAMHHCIMYHLCWEMLGDWVLASDPTQL